MADLQPLFLNLSARFAGLSYWEMDHGIEAAIADLGELTGVDRVYVFAISGQMLTNTHEWCAEGVSSEKDNLQAVPLEAFGTWLERLSRGEVVIIPQVADLPTERQAEREILAAQGIQSLLAVPMVGAQGLLGLVGFDSVRRERIWLPDEVALLQATANLIAGAWQRRAATEARNAAFERLGKLAKAVPGVLYQYQRYPDGRSQFTYLSDGIEQLCGLSAKAVMDDATVVMAVLHPEDQATILTLLTRSSTELGPWEGEFRVRHQDGLRWLHGQATPEAQADGSVLWHGYITDITERKAVQEALQSSEANLRALFDNTQDALLLVDRDYRLLAFNREAEQRIVRVLGVTPHVGLDLRLAVAERDPSMLQDLARGMAGETLQVERLTTRLDGSQYWVDVSITPVRDAQGRVLAAALRSADITLRYQTEQALRREAELRRTLLELTNELLNEDLGEGFYQLLLKRALAVVPEAQAGSLLMRSEDGLYRFKAAIGYDLDKLQALSLTERDLARRDLVAPELVWYEAENRRLDPEKQRILEEGGRVREIKVTLSTPITIAGKLGGFFNLDNFEHSEAFGPEAFEVVRALAGQAAIALQRLTLEAQLKAERSRFQHLAAHDALTGLPNRMLFNDRLMQALLRARRRQAVVGLAVFDLDGFKNVNDTLGHDAGDLLLQNLAKRLLGAIRAEDTLARLGGDEFALILTELAQAADAELVVSKLLKILEEPFELSGRRVQISASVGISLYPRDATVVGELFKCADLALYRVKGGNKRGYAFFDAEVDTRTVVRLERLEALRESLRCGRLSLHYQPWVEMATGRIQGLEAFARWRHPELGEIPPAEFIRLAEEHELIDELGGWLLERACADFAAWTAQGLTDGLRLAINVSPLQLRDGRFVERLRAALSRYELSPASLLLEINESALTRLDDMVPQLEAVHALGVLLVLDGSGLGSSFLERLAALPISTIKIDRSFVRRLAGTEHDRFAALIRTMLSLGQGLGVPVIAEGVELAAQQEALVKLGCRYSQGYFYSKPLPTEGIGAMLAALSPDGGRIM
jgi:diguanylate cyclase (GGDEF)-like protein/PAS domain S-box-containing protein